MVWRLAGAAIMLCLALLLPPVATAQTATPDSAATMPTGRRARAAVLDASGDTVRFTAADSLRLIAENAQPQVPAVAPAKFNPDPMRAMWLSALLPGLGQAYNHRYWKLPIVVGAFVGLGYGTSWNNRMLGDYTKAYRDITDSDPETRSYMNFFPSTTQESSIDVDWLTRSLKSKKDYYRRYRDMCIIGLVGIYALQIIDAYVDASLQHFDISPDLSLDVAPTVMPGHSSPRPSGLGLQCAFTF